MTEYFQTILEQVRRGRLGYTFTNNGLPGGVCGCENHHVLSLRQVEETHAWFWAGGDVPGNQANGYRREPIVQFLLWQRMESTTDVTVEAELQSLFPGTGRRLFVTFNSIFKVILSSSGGEPGGGRGILFLCMHPIENMIPNFTTTFNVYLQMEGPGRLRWRLLPHRLEA